MQPYIKLSYKTHFAYHHCQHNSLPSAIHPHLDVSVVQSLGELLKLLTHSEGDGVVSEGAASLDDELVPLLLDHLLQLQPQSNLS